MYFKSAAFCLLLVLSAGAFAQSTHNYDPNYEVNIRSRKRNIMFLG